MLARRRPESAKGSRFQRRESPARHRILPPTYDLRASQVTTPTQIVKFFWQVLHQHRKTIGSVLDMGAGDGRFAQFGHFEKYTGVEIDSTQFDDRSPRKNAKIERGCVFARRAEEFDACIGNPPYLRHHDIESPWKEATLERLGDALDTTLSGHGNLFLYFLALSLARTTPDGIAALVIPFDWVSRPSAASLRGVIRKNKWKVSVYRFSFAVFPGVDTTASISVIDKSERSGKWSFFDVSRDFKVIERRGVTGTSRGLLKYTRRGSVFARRGISPGNQAVFTLTEGERIHHGLKREDVVPCVTSLRGLGDAISTLDRKTFRELFVDGGRRCWLIKSRETPTPRLLAYLEAVPLKDRSTVTCERQTPWYKYEQIKAPPLLVHSGFTTNGPRVLVNSVGAIPVGAMYGIYGCSKKSASALRRKIAAKQVLSRVVPHSGRLRKIEVGQLNGVLKSLEATLDD